MILWGGVNSAQDEPRLLRALLDAVESPAAAAALPGDDPRLLAIARHHRLSPLLSILAGAALPPALATACRHDRVLTVARNLILATVAGDCVEALAAADVPSIVLKGLAYDALYPTPGARATGDIDLLVPNARRRAAFTVLDRLGFEPRAAAPGFDDADYHEVAWTGRSVEVDLHMGLAPFARCDIDYDAVWKGAQPLPLGRTKTLVLSAEHAAVFHALHMAIDHFAVPAIYLVDLTRLLPDAGSTAAAEATARAWRCARPLATALALARSFLPRWAATQSAAAAGRMATRIVGQYGTTAPLPRPEQLLRKIAHFDAVSDAIRYVAVQSRRNVRERWERSARRRSARERLAL
jgi:hypothetical protein